MSNIKRKKGVTKLHQDVSSLKAAAVTGAAAAATIAMPNIAFGAPKNFKDASYLALLVLTYSSKWRETTLKW